MPSPIRRPSCVVLLCAALLVLPAEVRADPPEPWGPQIFVGTFDVNAGGGVTMDAAGNFTVSFNFFFGGPTAQAFAGDGTPGPFFFIEPYGGLITFDPIASAALGVDDFVYVWEGSFEGLQARRYDLDGTALADPIQVTAGGSAFADVEPAVGRWAPANSMIVVWATDNPATGDTDGQGIDGRAFAADGTPLGSVLRMNSLVGGDQQAPDVAIASGAGILVAWESDGAGGDGDGFGIRAHRFTASGSSQALFQVNAAASGEQRRPSVAMAADGTALVVWQGPSTGTDPDGSIQGRLFDAQGDPLGSDFQINTSVAGDQSLPDASWFGDDCFQVVWRSNDGVYSQAVTLDGSLSGTETRVSTTTETVPFKRPTVAADGPRSAVSWIEQVVPGRSTSPLGVLDDAFVQRFRAGIFADGFESGDTTAWGATVP